MRIVSSFCLILILLAASFWSVAENNSPLANMKIAFLTADSSLEAMGLHSRAAWEFLAQEGVGEILFNHENKSFIDSTGTVRPLSDFDVIWYHQGDDVRDTALYRGELRAAITTFIKSGKGALLSGGALEMVLYLGLDEYIRPQRHYLENWRDPAPLVVVEKEPPVFFSLPENLEEVPMSMGGCRAVADFYWGGPGKGMVLANSPAGIHRPLVEYQHGHGHLLTFGWRWPDYADTGNPHRENLLTLTRNMLQYLATPSSWKPIRIRTEFPYTTDPDSGQIMPESFTALERSIRHLLEEYGDAYPQGKSFLRRLGQIRTAFISKPQDTALTEAFIQLQREALLANPLLDFDEVIFIRRNVGQMGLPDNSYGNEYLPVTGYDNSLQALSLSDNSAIRTLFIPEGDVFIGDIELHYDAEKILLSLPDLAGKWGIGEVDLASATLSIIPTIEDGDIHNFDACYLPDERIVFTSTAPIIGVPCVGGRSQVTNLYLRDTDGSIRRLTNDQDHNWCPAVLNDGRLLYQRWEYADIAHAFMRILFSANPAGCRQLEYYGSNSFWPTAMFYARAVPDHPSRFVAIVGGHHDAHRQGELVLFDPSLGRHEAAGVIQRIPGYGKKVEPVILDGLISTSWPRFLHPYPLSDSYYLVACKPAADALWGIYLVDRFDNFLLLHEEEGYAVLEPTAW